MTAWSGRETNPVRRQLGMEKLRQELGAIKDVKVEWHLPLEFGIANPRPGENFNRNAIVPKTHWSSAECGHLDHGSHGRKQAASLVDGVSIDTDQFRHVNSSDMVLLSGTVKSAEAKFLNVAPAQMFIAIEDACLKSPKFDRQPLTAELVGQGIALASFGSRSLVLAFCVSVEL